MYFFVFNEIDDHANRGGISTLVMMVTLYLGDVTHCNKCQIVGTLAKVGPSGGEPSRVAHRGPEN